MGVHAIIKWVRRLLRVVLSSIAILLPTTPIRAAPLPEIQIVSQSVESHFPDDLTFTVELRSDGSDIADAVLYYQIGWSDSEIIALPEPFSPGTKVTLTYVWDTQSETVPPFVEITYYWRIVDSDGNAFTTTPVRTEYVDYTHEWQSLGDENVVVYWYDRSEDFGMALLEAGVEGYDRVAAITGITTERVARVVIYNNQRDFCAFYGPRACQDWVGGQTFSGLTVQWGTNQDWFTYDVVPHELAHVFYNEVFRYTWVRVPTWFNEGIAVYNERTDHAREMKEVKDAAADGELIPLRHMATQASGLAHNDVGLWYSEAYSLVGFIADVYGEGTLGEVILTLAGNHPMEETLQSVLDMDLIAFEMAWREWLGYPVDTIPTPITLDPVTITPFPTFSREQLAFTPTPTGLPAAFMETLVPSPSPSPSSPVDSPASESPFALCCVSASTILLAALAWALVRSRLA